MAGNWKGWEQVSPKTMSLPAHIGAVSYRPQGTANYRLELFAVGTDLRMYRAFRSPGPADEPWHDWTPMSPTLTFQPGVPFATLEEDNDIKHLLALGQDGVVHWNSSTTGGGWDSWTAIEGQKFAKGTPISAVWSNPPPGPGSGLPGFYLDCFAVGIDGKVKQASMHSLTWSSWSSVQTKLFAAGTPIAAVSSKPGWIDLLAVANDHRIWRTQKHGVNASWSAWAPLPGGAAAFDLLTPLAVRRAGPGEVHVAAVGSSGDAQYVTYGVGSPTWESVASPPKFDAIATLALDDGSSPSAIYCVPSVGGEVRQNRRFQNSPGGSVTWSGWQVAPHPTAHPFFAAPVTVVTPLRPKLVPAGDPHPKWIDRVLVAADLSGRVQVLSRPVIFID